MTLADELKSVLLSNGASLVGYADLSGFRIDMRSNMQVGISIAVALNPNVIAVISKGPTKEYLQEYKQANKLLSRLGELAAKALTYAGYEARGLLPTSEDYNENTLAKLLPHKTSATRAGLGWIGKCALLVTKEYGSALRLTTVFTNANLPTGKPINESMCGYCNECVELCPAQALSGQDWSIKSEQDPIHGFMSNYNHFACRRTMKEITAKRIGIGTTICGICIANCPFTQKYTKNGK
jgi:epoxyqueuosine reductase QueG